MGGKCFLVPVHGQELAVSWMYWEEVEDTLCPILLIVMCLMAVPTVTMLGCGDLFWDSIIDTITDSV